MLALELENERTTRGGSLSRESPEGVHEDMNAWAADAACAGKPSKLFFLGPSNPQIAAKHKATVRAICGSCSVRPQCLSHALRYEEWGAWGGLTERELAAERKRLGGRLVPLAARLDNRKNNC